MDLLRNSQHKLERARVIFNCTSITLLSVIITNVTLSYGEFFVYGYIFVGFVGVFARLYSDSLKSDIQKIKNLLNWSDVGGDIQEIRNALDRQSSAYDCFDAIVREHYYFDDTYGISSDNLKKEVQSIIERRKKLLSFIERWIIVD